MPAGRSRSASVRSICARQVPDAEKRARADHVIDTGQGIEIARAQVRALVARLRKEAEHA